MSQEKSTPQLLLDSLSEDDIKRFHSKYTPGNEEDCWPWLGGTFNGRRARFSKDGHPILVSRVICYLRGDEIDGKIAMHKCDNEICCNPNHIKVGTQSDNMKDCYDKGRSANIFPRNEAHHATKLKQGDVGKIKELRQRGCRQSEIARLFNVDPAHISRILSGKARKFANY